MLPVLSPSELVALVNQTLEFAMPIVEIQGEVTNYRVSKNRWVYFDIADEFSRVRCFGVVYTLPGPVEDGMVVRIQAAPRLHPSFGFSLNISSLQFSGEGTIKKAADLLKAQLEKEGLFAPERKRALPYPPERIALVTSAESAAYEDFVKVLGARWGGMEIKLADVTVQGESAPGQIVRAIEWFNKSAELTDALVVIRGGGSADDLQAFSSEQVVRAVAASRIPTLVAIGHEIDLSLAELAADRRASTPSNAAELLVPDRRELLARNRQLAEELYKSARSAIDARQQSIDRMATGLYDTARSVVDTAIESIQQSRRTLEALSPQATLRRGYSITRSNGVVVRTSSSVKRADKLVIELADGIIDAEAR